MGGHGWSNRIYWIQDVTPCSKVPRGSGSMKPQTPDASREISSQPPPWRDAEQIDVRLRDLRPKSNPCGAADEG